MLVLLAEFCIKVYFPNFFEVEAKSSITDKIMSLRETLTAGHTDNFQKQAARK